MKWYKKASEGRKQTFHSWACKWLKGGLHRDWIWSSSCFVFPDSQKQLWCVLISVTAGQWTGLHIAGVFLLGYHLCQPLPSLCVRVYMRVCLMANEGRIPQSPERLSRQPLVIILREAEPNAGTATCSTCTLTPGTLGGILQSFICSPRCKYIHSTHMHALSVWLAGFWSHLAPISEKEPGSDADQCQRLGSQWR